MNKLVKSMKILIVIITKQLSHVCKCHEYSITVENIFDGVLNMKPGKSCDDREIFSEHILLGSYSLFLRFAHLFNSMLRHGYVPSHFKSGVIVPLVKDHQGNISSPDN
jgi:hypothetical protein